MKQRKINVGVIGTGNMAQAHVEQYRKIHDVEIVTCFDVDSEKAKSFAERHQIPNTSVSVDDLSDSVDAVSIVTPDRFHADLTISFLAAGKHVLCEKPLTVTLDEAWVVAAAAKKAETNGVINMVNFSYRSSAALQEAIKIAKSGQLGQIRHVHSFYLQQWLNGGGINSSNATPGTVWRLSSALGSAGVLGDLGCHILDLTSAASEDFVGIRCELRTFPKLVDGKYATSVNGINLDANDTALIEFELLNGGVGISHTTRWATAHGNHLRLEVHGTEGAMAFDLSKDYNSIDLTFGDELRENPWGNSSITKTLETTPTNWERFISSIRTGVQDQPDIQRGAVIQSYLDACERSAKSGRWEKIAAPV